MKCSAAPNKLQSCALHALELGWCYIGSAWGVAEFCAVTTTCVSEFVLDLSPSWDARIIEQNYETCHFSPLVGSAKVRWQGKLTLFETMSIVFSVDWSDWLDLDVSSIKTLTAIVATCGDIVLEELCRHMKMHVQSWKMFHGQCTVWQNSCLLREAIMSSPNLIQREMWPCSSRRQCEVTIQCTIQSQSKGILSTADRETRRCSWKRIMK